MHPNPSPRAIRQLTNENFLNLFVIEPAPGSGHRPWIFASRKKSAGAGQVSADAVVIAATVTHKGKPHLLITREYRAPLGGYEISLPSGLVSRNS